MLKFCGVSFGQQFQFTSNSFYIFDVIRSFKKKLFEKFWLWDEDLLRNLVGNQTRLSSLGNKGE